MDVRGPKNVRRALQTDPKLFRYASVIRERKKCSELLAQKFDRFQTLGNNYQNTQQSVQKDAKSNIQQFWGVVGQ